MLDKAYAGRIVNLLINIFLGVAMVLTGLLLGGGLQPMPFVQNLLVSVGVGYLLCDFIPAPRWAAGLVKRLRIKNTLAAHLLSSAVSGAVFITCISFTCQFIAFGGAVFSVWPYTLPYLLLVGYAVLVVFMPLCQRVAALLTE